MTRSLARATGDFSVALCGIDQLDEVTVLIDQLVGLASNPGGTPTFQNGLDTEIA
jgi:hypothetical protein